MLFLKGSGIISHKCEITFVDNNMSDDDIIRTIVSDKLTKQIVLGAEQIVV